MTDDRKNNSRGGKPGHRRWLRWLPVGLLAGLFFCFIAPFILVRFETPRNWMLDNGPGNWLLGAGTRLRVGNVHRLDPGGASFSGIVLSCKDSLGDWSDWARISHLNTSWDISDLIWGRYSIDRLELDSVSVNLQRSCVPHWHAEAGVVDELADPGPGRARSVRCSHFGLQHLSLLREGMPVGESRMELNSIQLEKGDLRLDVDSIRVLLAAGALRPSSAEMALNFSGGDLRYESKGTLRLDHLDVRSAGLEGQLWLRQSRGSEWFVTMQLEKILPAEMMDSLRLQVPDPYSPGTSDTLTGSINLTFVPDTLALHGELQGFWGGGPADIAGLVQRTPEGWQAEEIHLKRPGADLIFSGRADSEFAHIDGDVTFQKTNLNGPDFPWRASPIGRTNLAGSTQFVYRRPKNEIWEIIYSLRLGPSAIGNQRLDGLQARGLVTSSFVQADTFLIDLDEGRLTGGGRFDLQDGVMNAAIRLENVPAPAITDPFLDAPVEGRLFGRLQMQKTGEAMRIYGSLDGRDINWGELAASEIRLPWVDYTIPGNHLDGRVRLSGFHAGAFAADSVWLEIQDLEMGILVRGGTRFSDQAVSIVGILDPAPEGGLQIENFEWRPPEGAAWDAEKPFFIGWGSRGVSIDGLSLISPAGDLSFDGLWGAENNVEGRFSLHGDFLPLLSSWGLRPEATGGEINCDASLSGYWPNPGMSVRFQSDSLALWNWPLNDFTGALDWREGAIDLRRLQARGRWGAAAIDSLQLFINVDFATFLSHLSSPDSLHLPDTPWAGAATFRNLDLDRLMENSGWRIDEYKPRTVQDTATRDLESIIRIVRPKTTIEGSYDAIRPEGILDIDLNLSGTPAHPLFHLNVEGKDAAYRRTRLDSLSLKIDYESGELSIRDLHWLKEGLGGAISGVIPLELSALPAAVHLPNDGEDIDLHLNIPKGNLAIWSSLSELLQEPKGVFQADLRIQGPLHPPLITGNLTIDGGSLRIPLREERLEEIHAKLRMDSLGVHLESVKARIGPKGRITATGRFLTLEDMDLDLTVREGLFFETGVYRVEADGNIRIISRVDSISGQIRPHVLGDAYIREAMILDITPRKIPGPVRPTPWLIQLDVEAPTKIMVTQPTTQLMLGNGKLVVSERDNWWNLAGGIDVQGGWYRVFNNQFAVRSGDLEFQDSGSGIEVRVNLQAETQATEVLSAEGEPVGAVTVKVDVTGRADELQVALSSEPELSREEIIELLSFGRIASHGSGRDAASGETRDFLISEMVARLENQLSEEIPWLNRVRVAPDMDEILIQPILSPQFSLNYAQELSSSPAQEVTMHYRLSNILYLKAGVLRESVQGGHSAEEYNLDLKFRIEYE